MTEQLRPLPKTAPHSGPVTRSQAQTELTQLQTLAPDAVVFRLVKLANLMTRPFFGRFAKRHELTINEWRSIVVLAARPDSAAQDISATAGLHPMNVSRAVIGLRKAGMVSETRDPENHRRTLLRLTEAGEDTFKKIAPHAERQAQLLLATLSPEELAVLNRTIDKLIARAEEIAE